MSFRVAYLAMGLLAVSAAGAEASVAEGLKLLEAGKIADSVKTLQAAYESGDPDGAFYLGRLFEMGIGTDKDMQRAAALYTVAAAKKSVKAENRLGLMYLNGEVVLQDYKRAGELICAAADAGDANGQFNCGLLHSEGKGFAKDMSAAIAYWQKAADQNHVAAINFLGQTYLKGTDVTPDAAKALGYFRRTGDAGNPMGLMELARAYSEGKGMAADLVKAHAYANLAAARGHEEAAAFRDAIAAKLSPADVEKAQAFARDWKPLPIEKTGQ